MIFVDTNVLVYVRLDHAQQGIIARRLLQQAIIQDEIAISRQVIREYLAVVTRQQVWPESPLSMAQALQDVEQLRINCRVLDNNDAVLNHFMALCMDVPVAGARVHDTNIVATMLAYDVELLLTFDTDDFRRYGSRIALVDTA